MGADKTNEGSGDLDGELVIIQDLLGVINSLKDSHPDWYYYLEEVDPDLANREEMMDLLQSAPTPEAKFFIFGKLTMRIQLARLYGNDRDFLKIVEMIDQN